MKTPVILTPAVGVGESESHIRLPWNTPVQECGTRTAVVAVHGMGQQMAFSTLADVAEAIRATGGGPATATARNVTMIGGGESPARMSRVELRGMDGRDVDVYEAYWAPLTEGVVTLRNVLSFLFHAGISNLSRRPLTRTIFGARVRFPVDPRATLLLAIALATVGSLVVINTTMVVVIAAKFLRLPWPPNALVVDLSVVVAILSIFALCLGVMVGLASDIKQYAKRWSMMRGLTWIIWTELGVLLVALTATSSSMLVALWYHWTPRGTSVALALLGERKLERLADVSWRLLLLLAGMMLISRLMKSPALSRALLLVTIAANGVLLWLIWRWLETPRVGPAGLPEPTGRWVWVWIILFAVSSRARRFLVQYVGDVAAYVQPHRLDRFHAIREQIRQAVCTAAEAVYRAADRDGVLLYDRVVIVAHSLGSVAAYDVLNTLLRIDSARGGHINVAGRTRALVTFGSPLDKIALLFGKQHASEMAEALAASLQPLIQKTASPRPDWINIYSPNDIISGRLDYFGHLQNVIDHDATTPFAAHVEYWKNPLLWKTVSDCL